MGWDALYISIFSISPSPVCVGCAHVQNVSGRLPPMLQALTAHGMRVPMAQAPIVTADDTRGNGIVYTPQVIPKVAAQYSTGWQGATELPVMASVEATATGCIPLAPCS